MPEQDPSRLEAFKARLDSTADLVKTKAAIGLIGVVGITGSSVAVAEQISAEPAIAADTPVATGSDQMQDCIGAGLQVEVLKSEMFRPGDPHSQSIVSKAHLQPTSDPCLQSGITRKNPTVTFQIENPKKPDSYFTAGKPQGLKGRDGPLGNEGGIGEAYIAPVFAIKNPNLRYRCSKKGTTEVRAIYHTEVDDADGNKLGEKDRTVHVRIRPVHGPLTHKGAVRHAC